MVYNCDVCGKAFGYLFSMKKHREKHAPFCNTGTFQPSFAGEEHHLCILCNRLFSCYASLKRHQLTTHTENGPVFHCCYCPYSNSFSWQVKRHIYKRHGLDESYFCGGCKTFFRSANERDRHVCQAPSNRFKQHSMNTDVIVESGTNSQLYDPRKDGDISVDDAEAADSRLSIPNGQVKGEVDVESSINNNNDLKQPPNSEKAEKQREINVDDDVMASSGDTSDTPCICSECGTCLPCFEDMAKHQLAHHPAKIITTLPPKQINGNGKQSSEDNTGPSAASQQTSRFVAESRRRNFPSFTSSSAIRDQLRPRSPLNVEPSFAKRCESQGFQDEKQNNRNRQSTGQLYLPGSNSSNNEMLLTTVNETGESLSPSSDLESPSSSPSILLPNGQHNQNSWECSFCGISFSDPALWGLHSSMHDVNDLSKCNFCGRQSSSKYDFWRHFIDHNKVPSVSTVSLATPPVSSSSCGTVPESTTPVPEPIVVASK